VNVSTPVSIDRFQAIALGLDVTASRYAVPVRPDCLGICIECGHEVSEGESYVHCECWSSELREAKESLMHASCLARVRSEW
jgi:hypothetical protein